MGPLRCQIMMLPEDSGPERVFSHLGTCSARRPLPSLIDIVFPVQEEDEGRTLFIILSHLLS